MSAKLPIVKTTRIQALKTICALALLCSTAHAEPFLYVAASGSGNVAVIDLATDAVVAGIDVANHPSGVAANAIGTRVYVGSLAGDAVSVIATTSNQVIASIAVGHSPAVLTFNPSNNRLYVSDDDGIAVVDAASNTVIDRISGLAPPALCQGVAVSHSGDRVFAVRTEQRAPGSLVVIDASTDAIIKTVPVMLYPCSVVVSPDDSKVYVNVNAEGNSPTLVVDASDYSVTSTSADDGVESGFAISDAGTMYVPEVWQMRSFDASTGQYETSVPMAASTGYSYGVAFGPAQNKLYIANSGSNTVTVEDLKNSVFLYGIVVGYFPNGLAVVSQVNEIFKASFD